MLIIVEFSSSQRSMMRGSPLYRLKTSRYATPRALPSASARLSSSFHKLSRTSSSFELACICFEFRGEVVQISYAPSPQPSRYIAHCELSAFHRRSPLRTAGDTLARLGAHVPVLHAQGDPAGWGGKLQYSISTQRGSSKTICISLVYLCWSNVVYRY